MTTKRISPPPPKFIDLCDQIDRAAGLLLQDVGEAFPDLGRYESDVEARVLFVGLLRHVEAVLECARADLVLLPAATTITRAVLEQSTKIRWLLLPTDVFDREARFLAHLSDEERMWERCAKDAGVNLFLERAAAIAEFREGVEKILPPTTTPLRRVPSLKDMLTELGDTKRYVAYTLLSQTVHASHFGGATYRRGLGTAKKFGEWISPADWAFLLEVCWWSLFTAARDIEHTCAKRNLRSVTQPLVDEIAGRLAELRDSKGAADDAFRSVPFSDE
jgi:hypothetical protein